MAGISGYSAGLSQLHLLPKYYKEIIEAVLDSKPLQKMLYYSDRKALSCPDLTEDQFLELPNKYFKITPKVEKNFDQKQFIVLSVSEFIPQNIQQDNNFKDFVLNFDIFVHLDNWQLEGYMLRAFEIAAEIDDRMVMSLGIRSAPQFLGAESSILSDDFGIVRLRYLFDTF